VELEPLVASAGGVFFAMAGPLRIRWLNGGFAAAGNRIANLTVKKGLFLAPAPDDHSLEQILSRCSR
jgi:hypothetical protein